MQSVPPRRGGSSVPFLLVGLIGTLLVFACCVGILIVGYLETDGFKLITDQLSAPGAPTLEVRSTSAAATLAPATSAPSTPTAPAGPSPTARKKAPPTETPVPSPTLPPIPKVKPIKMNSPEYGAQAFLWWRPETADRDLGLMKDAGLTWVKQQFAWRDIEGAGKGKFDWNHADQAVYLANSKGIDVLARIDNAPEWAAPGCFNAEKKTMGPAKNSQDWVDFLKTFATRYKGRIRMYEIWNEPNLSREWCNKPPSPKEYAALLKISYQTIKAIDPNVIVVSGGLTPTSQSDARAMPDIQFFEQMYTAMNNKSDGYFDALGVHAPGFAAPPETSPDDVAKNKDYNNGEPVTGRIYSFRHVEDVRKVMVQRGDSSKQIVILEFGWTTDQIHPAYSWFSVDDQTQGKYIVRAYQYAKKNWAGWIGAMFVIYFANPDWDKNYEEYWWSITEPNGTPRAAYVHLKAMTK